VQSLHRYFGVMVHSASLFPDLWSGRCCYKTGATRRQHSQLTKYDLSTLPTAYILSAVLSLQLKGDKMKKILMFVIATAPAILFIVSANASTVCQEASGGRVICSTYGSGYNSQTKRDEGYGYKGSTTCQRTSYGVICN
jgi:hypothetical protein